VGTELLTSGSSSESFLSPSIALEQLCQINLWGRKFKESSAFATNLYQPIESITLRSRSTTPCPISRLVLRNLAFPLSPDILVKVLI